MKEIKAYVRKVKIEGIVRALEKESIYDLTIMDVMALGSQADPEEAKISIEIIEKYTKVYKIEIVCRDERLNKIVEILREAAFTGSPGDGIIYVSPVEQAVKIRSGKSGDSILQE